MGFGVARFMSMVKKSSILKLIYLMNSYNKSTLYPLIHDTEKIFKNLLREINNKPKSVNRSLKSSKEETKNYVIKNNEFIIFLY